MRAAAIRSSLAGSPRSRWTRLAALGVLLAGGAVAVASSACVEAEAEFYISTPTSIDMDGTCADDPICPSVTVVVGAGAVGDQYRCFRVTSGLIPRAVDDTNHVETNRIILSEVDVEVLDGNGTVIDSFSRATNGIVEPNLPESSEDQVVAMPIMRTEAAQKLAPGDEIVIGIILKGRTTGGNDMETPEFYVNGIGTDIGGSSC
jgi:hypothetical protein